MYGVLAKRVMEGRFVMLLAGSWCSKTGEGGGVAGGVGKAVGRGRREGFDGVIGREAISAQDIGFFGVEAGVVGGEDDATVAGGDIGAEGANEGEVGGLGGDVNVTVGAGVVDFSGFICFVRTCS